MRYTIDQNNASWRVVDGEAVIIHLVTTHYYGLNATGTFLWNLLAEKPHTAAELAAALAGHYGEPVETVTADVDEILAGLVAEQLVKEA